MRVQLWKSWKFINPEGLGAGGSGSWMLAAGSVDKSTNYVKLFLGVFYIKLRLKAGTFLVAGL